MRKALALSLLLALPAFAQSSLYNGGNPALPASKVDGPPPPGVPANQKVTAAEFNNLVTNVTMAIQGLLGQVANWFPFLKAPLPVPPANTGLIGTIDGYTPVVGINGGQYRPYSTTINVKDFGAWGTAVADTTCSVTFNSSLVTCSDGPFVGADAGMLIVVAQALDGGYPLVGTISSVVSATQVHASSNATATTGPTDSMVFGYDDTASIQKAFNYLRTDIGGPTGDGGIGAATVQFPAGFYLTSASIRVNTDFEHPRIAGEGWTSTFIYDTGADAGGVQKGALNIYGSNFFAGNGGGGFFIQPENSAWTEVRDFAIGALNDNGIQADEWANHRMHDVWIYNAGGNISDAGTILLTNPSTAYLTLGIMGVGEYSNIRLGPGNMCNVPGPVCPPLQAPITVPAYGIYMPDTMADAGTYLGFQSEQHFDHVNSHASTASHGVYIVNTDTVTAPFDVTFNDCEIKVQPPPYGVTGISSWYIDGAEVKLINVASEESGTTTNFITAAGSYNPATVSVIGSSTYGGNIVINQSDAGVNMTLVDVNQIRSATLTGTPGSYKLQSIYTTWQNFPTFAFESIGDRWLNSANPPVAKKGFSPEIYATAGNVNQVYMQARYFNNDNQGPYVALWKGRGTVNSPAAADAGDTIAGVQYTVCEGSNCTSEGAGAWQVAGQDITSVGSLSGSGHAVGQKTFLLQDGSGVLQNALVLNPNSVTANGSFATNSSQNTGNFQVASGTVTVGLTSSIAKCSCSLSTDCADGVTAHKSPMTCSSSAGTLSITVNCADAGVNYVCL